MAATDRRRCGSLAAAVATLLRATPALADEDATEPTWELDATLYYYQELGRIGAGGPVISASHSYEDLSRLQLRFAVDVVTGPSPNGARAMPVPQTFTSPSGRSSYTVPAGETPLNPQLQDTRVSGLAAYEWRLHRHHTLALSLAASQELDFASLSPAIGYTGEFAQRNTTLSLQLRSEHDWIFPQTGFPTPMSAPTPQPGGEGEAEDAGQFRTRWTPALALGVTQLLSKFAYVQAGYSVQRSRGYLTDPYKIVTVLDASGQLDPATPYVFESRPNHRLQQALGLELVTELAGATARAGYRFYWDDWGIRTHTVDGWVHLPLGLGLHAGVGGRYSRQYPADFYHYDLTSDSLPRYASGDYRLGNLATVEAATRVGIPLAESQELRFRFAYIRQLPVAGAQFPAVTALFAQASYEFAF